MTPRRSQLPGVSPLSITTAAGIAEPPAGFAISMIRDALGVILSVSKRGKQPKTSRLAINKTKGSLRQKCGASATCAHFAGNSACKTLRTARSM